MSKALLLSIKPRFAEAILDGTKLFELRKVKPRVGAGDLVLIYVTSPRCRLEGAFRVASVIEATPEKLWPKVKGKCSLTKSEFFSYYEGKTTAFAIAVDEAWTLETALDLRDLRSESIIPPQGYRYLTSDKTAALIGG